MHVLLNLHTIPQPYTADVIVEYLKHTLSRWQIDPQKVLFVVTDSSSNMVKAVRMMSLAVPSDCDSKR